MLTAEEELADKAYEIAGNWKHFESFCWHGEPEDSLNWGIIYTHNRDSRLLELSNAGEIAKVMAPFAEGDDPDVVFESHNHFAVGHVDGFSIRAIKNSEPTEAVKKYLELVARMEDYSILNESDYSERETEATEENFEEAVRGLDDEFNFRVKTEDGWKEQEEEDWHTAIYEYLSNNTNALESRDDQGGYPSKEELHEACKALDYRKRKH